MPSILYVVTGSLIALSMGLYIGSWSIPLAQRRVWYHIVYALQWPIGTLSMFLYLAHDEHAGFILFILTFALAIHYMFDLIRASRLERLTKGQANVH